MWKVGKPAPKAQVWFALTPLFGALWAFLVLGEQITYHELSGAALLLAAIAISASPSGDATGGALGDPSRPR